MRTRKRAIAVGAVAAAVLVGGVVWLIIWWMSLPRFEDAWVTADDEEIEVTLFHDTFFQPPRYVTCNHAADDDPALSRDGNRLAFASDRNGNWDIFILADDECFKFRDGGRTRITDLVDTRVRQLTSDPGTDRHPAWSPNGSEIAFDSDRSGSPQIFVMRKDGTGVRQLTHAPSPSSAPSWSPDGRQIVFQAERDGNSDLHTIAPDGSGEQSLTQSGANETDPAWSKDGAEIAFVSDRDGDLNIYVIDVSTREERAITRARTNYVDPAWKRNKIFFSRDRQGRWATYSIDRRAFNEDGIRIEAGGRSLTSSR